MSRRALWALSPLPPGGDVPTGVVLARCGKLLARVVLLICEQPPDPVCPRCALIYLVEFEGPRFGRQTPAGPP